VPESVQELAKGAAEGEPALAVDAVPDVAEVLEHERRSYRAPHIIRAGHSTALPSREPARAP
jgi:hypothetical protein